MEAYKIKRSFDENKRVFVGISPDTSTPMFMLPIDVFLRMDRNEALSRAANLAFKDGSKARLASHAELKRIFSHAAHIEGSMPNIWVWASDIERQQNCTIGIMHNLSTGKWDYFREDTLGRAVFIITPPAQTP